MTFGIASVAVISVLVWWMGHTVKVSPIEDKWIPTICGLCGILLGIVAYLMNVPDFPANDVLTAAAVGCVSGLSATGLNEAVKQMKYDR